MAGRNMNERLKYLRKESKITQDQLAQFLSVDQSMITKLENGTRRLSITMVDKICSLFAGVGGIDLGFIQTNKCEVAYANEFDKYAGEFVNINLENNYGY